MIAVKMMKSTNDQYIWFMDCSWAGSIMVVAQTEEEARTFMEAEENYDPKLPVMRYEIERGLVLAHLGDL